MVASILKEKIQQRLNEAEPQYNELLSNWEKTQKDFNEWIKSAFSKLSNEFLTVWKSGVTPTMSDGAWVKVMDNTEAKQKNINELVKIIHEYWQIVMDERAENSENNFDKLKLSIKKVQDLKAKANNRIK